VLVDPNAVRFSDLTYPVIGRRLGLWRYRCGVGQTEEGSHVRRAKLRLCTVAEGSASPMLPAEATGSCQRRRDRRTLRVNLYDGACTSAREAAMARVEVIGRRSGAAAVLALLK
jgi:hypothetical protein